MGILNGNGNESESERFLEDRNMGVCTEEVYKVTFTVTECIFPFSVRPFRFSSSLPPKKVFMHYTLFLSIASSMHF
jgi:hypothetical protein